MSDNSSDRDPVEALAEEFIQRKRRGERPTLEEYAAKYPHLADDIHDLFPALVMMEDFKPDTHSVAGSAEEQASEAIEPAVREIGDYRILRVVGRGGMGIVYEAEQISLGRRVALKVLPKNLLTDNRQKHRFEREARAAARLHHTNIVPVFGVGEQDGLHYYVMQFIQGLGLDEVLAELKRMRPADGPASSPSGELRVTRKTTEDAAAESAGPLNGGRDVSAANIAHSMMTGEFAGRAESDEPRTDRLQEVTLDHQNEHAVTPSISGRLSDTFSLSDSSVALARSDSSDQAAARRSYWQSVADLGIQVASALQYAHDQGVLHRDVKPSNLLLDTRGTAWVTDFGLAKAEDQQNLTHLLTPNSSCTNYFSAGGISARAILPWPRS